MGRSKGRWWIDDEKRWREGEPPTGWFQGPDRRWYPPTDNNYAPTQQMATIGASSEATGELALASTPLRRMMVLATLIVLIAVVGGILAISSMGSDSSDSAEQEESPEAGAQPDPSFGERESSGADGVEDTTTAGQSTSDGAEPEGEPDPPAGNPGNGGGRPSPSTTTTSQPSDQTTTTTDGSDDDDQPGPATCPPGRPDHPRCS